MKTIKIATLFFLTLFLLTGCGIHTAMVGNLNGNVTNVELNCKNFKVLERISGSSTATYILGIGGVPQKALIEKAKADMFAGHDLTGTSRAIVNVTVEEHLTAYFIFYAIRTITVSAHLIEFTE